MSKKRTVRSQRSERLMLLLRASPPNGKCAKNLTEVLSSYKLIHGDLDMTTALDQATSIFARRCKYVCKTAATFSAACSRYPRTFFEGQATSRDSLHALSQLMIVS